MNFFKDPKYKSLRMVLLLIVIVGAGYFVIGNMNQSDSNQGLVSNRIKTPATKTLSVGMTGKDVTPIDIMPVDSNPIPTSSWNVSYNLPSGPCHVTASNGMDISGPNGGTILYSNTGVLVGCLIGTTVYTPSAKIKTLGIGSDGSVKGIDGKFIGTIIKSSTKISSITPKVLSLGAKSDEIKTYQMVLQNADYLSATTMLTGIYDVATKAAVLKFQKDKGLTETGNIDIPTRSALKSLIILHSKIKPVNETIEIIANSFYIDPLGHNNGCTVVCYDDETNPFTPEFTGTGFNAFSSDGVYLGCVVGGLLWPAADAAGTTL